MQLERREPEARRRCDKKKKGEGNVYQVGSIPKNRTKGEESYLAR